MPCFMKVNIRFISPWFGRYPSKKEPCFPPEAKSWENWNHHCSCFLGAMSRQAKVGGGNLYFPFSYICVEQQNESMWWPICNCKWKMRPINLHSQFKQKERGDAIRVTNTIYFFFGKMFPHRLYLLSL